MVARSEEIRIHPKLPKLKSESDLMKVIERFSWTVGFSLKSYGVRVGLQSNNPDILNSMFQHLPAEWEGASSNLVDRIYSIREGPGGANPGARRRITLYADQQRLMQSANLAELLEVFESSLRLFVAEFASKHVFVHAGVVAWKGRAIIIPGRSYTGKSTLVAELVRAGATYYSDEYAVFDSRGRVHPYFKPLELREEGKFAQSKISIGELGGESGTKPLPVGLVVVTHYKNGAHWRPRRLTAGKGVLELLFNTVSARRDPERALATLELASQKAHVLKGVRGQATDVVRAVLKRAEGNGRIS